MDDGRASWHCCVLLLALSFSGTAGCQPLTRHTLNHANRTRVYHLHNPQGASPSPAQRALVLVLHGAGNNGPDAARMTGMNEESDANGFLVAYPEGTGCGLQRTWNARVCCDPALSGGVDDVGFLEAVIDDIAATHAIDPRRIYVAGFSNGAMMTHILGCQLGDRIAAIAAVAGAVDVANCPPADPVSLIAFHGMRDTRVKPAGGVFHPSWGGRSYPDVTVAVNSWRSRNNCTQSHPLVQTPAADIERHTNPATGVEVVFYSVTQGSHSWPGGRRVSLLGQSPANDPQATDLIWEFFDDHPKP